VKHLVLSMIGLLASCAVEQIRVAERVDAGTGDASEDARADDAGDATSYLDADGDADMEPDADAGRTDGGIACKSERDCDFDEYCEKASCDSSLGTCVSRPVLCDAKADFSCGCDGVTYYNDCLRRASGVSSAASGQCEGGQAATCGQSQNDVCPRRAYCFKQVDTPDACSVDTPGTCWVIPQRCEMERATNDVYGLCGNGGGCIDLCDAIRAESPAYYAPCHGTP